ncbi:bifunctional MFS transporter/dTMP kinase [Amycolatopsis taiwanensis]|uniref:Thymidylate kinase n=1 Tax=Amycolatopsis taiwanensis TaxID=342230 RepID=A0A9W6VJK4_9PSEU|nr:MFS transporter [Amycolatopsis taiwanensis]GLY68601.1 dTMP kinase [Amycolatopsis taiwanensis]
MGRISEVVQTKPDVEAPAGREASTIYRARRVLAIRPFRRLWGVTYLCSVADWLTILGVTSMATKLTQNYTAQNFAFTGVLLSALLPGLLFAPAGGLLADRFDRRKVMFCADLLRCGFIMSIALVGTGWWLYTANFLASASAMMWIPSKDAAVPNLLRRPDQVETANQLGMVMTYGLAVVSAGAIYSFVTGIGPALHLPASLFGQLGFAKVIVVLIGLLYLTSAILIITRIPELSLRNTHAAAVSAPKPKAEAPGLGALLKDAGRFVRSTPLVRGLLIGAAGAFAAGGAVVGSAQPYAASLLAGDSAWGLLLVAVFLGLASGMGGAPKLARRLPHDRLFGISIVLAGLALILVALSPHLVVSLVAVAIVGACAGAAFLTGVTIIGSQVDDAIRGRINAIYQAMMKIIVFGSTAMVPLLIGLTRPRTITIWGNEIIIDGTRPVMLGGGILAALVGVVAYRQMDSRRSETIMADLRNVIRRRPKRVNGLLIALEGTTAADTASQAAHLAEWLRSAGPRPVVLAADPALDDKRLAKLVSGASLSGARAQALAAAAVRADIVERDVQPALDGGSIVVMERFVDSPLAHLSAVAGLDAKELEGLADWATGRLRPDVTVLLDAAPTGAAAGPVSVEDQWRVQNLLSEMAAADPDHYVVVDGDGDEDEVAARVRSAVQAILVGRRSGLAPIEVAP